MVLQAPEFGLLGEHLVLFGFTCGFVVGNVRFKDSRKSARNGGGKASQESGTCYHGCTCSKGTKDFLSYPVVFNAFRVPTNVLVV